MVLAKDDYYRRITSPVPMDNELNSLVEQCRVKLCTLIKTAINLPPFNPSLSAEVSYQLKCVEEQINKQEHPLAEKKGLTHIRNILSDLNKINQLKPLCIPQDNNSSLIYCILDEKVTGVTEKVALVSLDTVKSQLKKLSLSNLSSIDEYADSRKYYQLTTEAIIKLPKHGKIEEVQHEAIALNISRILGLDTTGSTTLSHNHQPALFVPFDDICLLSEFSSGKIIKSFFSEPYTHYSTIKPLGEGVQANRYVDDFGAAFALLYLCSDTDAIGGSCQNKALRNFRTLYIFDQVLMNDLRMDLDSRLNLNPQTLFRHTRHGQGRNRTLIEDSSMETKFASIIRLVEKNSQIIQYLDSVINEHHCRAKQLHYLLNKKHTAEQTQIYKTELSDVQEFENDAKQLKEKIQERINKINDILPQIKGELSAREMRQALILEKLIHNPTLFTDDGRPYRNQWTPRHTNPIQLIEVQGNDMLTIHFKTLVREDIVDFIKRQSGASSIKLNTPNMLSLSIIHLHQLNESILHPEHSLTPNLTYNYLALEDLEILKSAYGEGNGAALLSLISEYHKEQNQISCLKHVEDQIIKLTATASDKGFGMHVLKKFHFDAFQRLSSLINQSTRLNRAFSGALKLDRASIFIDVLQTAISQNKTHSPSFIYFLESCNNRSTRASNFTQALTESNALLKEANKTIQQWFSHKSSQFEKIPRKAATLRKDHAFFQLEQEQVNESMPNHEIKCES